MTPANPDVEVEGDEARLARLARMPGRTWADAEVATVRGLVARAWRSSNDLVRAVGRLSAITDQPFDGVLEHAYAARAFFDEQARTLGLTPQEYPPSLETWRSKRRRFGTEGLSALVESVLLMVLTAGVAAVLFWLLTSMRIP